MADLSIRGLSKSYGSATVVDNIDLDINDQELLVLLGPSGGGKTTTLRLVAGLELPNAGSITLGDQQVERLRPEMRNVAMVFQDYGLYPHMTVLGNISFPLRARRVSKTEVDGRVKAIAERLGLADVLHRKPHEISGGQQQRVAVARALVRDSDLLLLDEPLSSVDIRLRDTMRKELLQLKKELCLTIVYVTHDQAEAMILADRIAIMRDGIIEQVGDPRAVYDGPTNLFVAEFLGSPTINFFEAEVYEGCVELGGVSVAVNSSSTKIHIGFRPEHTKLGAAGMDQVAFESEITSVYDLGSYRIVNLRHGQVALAALSFDTAIWSVNQCVTASVNADQLLFFDVESGKRIERRLEADA